MRVVPTTRKEVSWERGHGQPRHDVLNKQKLLVWIKEDCDHTNKVIYLSLRMTGYQDAMARRIMRGTWQVWDRNAGRRGKGTKCRGRTEAKSLRFSPCLPGIPTSDLQWLAA